MSDKIKMEELLSILQCMLKDELIAEIGWEREGFFLAFADGSRFRLTLGRVEE